MNLTGILLFAGLLQVSAHGTAQTVTYEAKNASLGQVFAVLKQQTGYRFFYVVEDLEGTKPVSVKLYQAPLETALETILSDQPLGFIIQGNTVAIIRSVKTPASAPVPAFDVHGRVVNESGEPLAGATVTIKGASKGTTTNTNGEFNIAVPDNGTLLIFSFVGYETQELAARNIPAGSVITMKASSQNLKDVVVNKGYYSVRQKENTGNVNIVDSKTIQEQPVSDPIQALIGRVPGLVIQQTSGVPGAYAKIQIRGQNSIANGNDPLYIIDGVPFSSLSLSMSRFSSGPLGYGDTRGNVNGQGMSPFNGLNPADIESIEVLKDADATAIYGSRGANGVILITTKKGKAGGTRFDLNVYTGAGKVTRMMDLLNTRQYLAMRREAFQNDGLPVPSITTSPTDYNYDINGVWDTTRYTDWQKIMIGNAATFTNAQGALSGGNSNTQFVLGGGYSKQGTVYPGNFNDQKASVHVNVTHASADHRFSAQFIANYVNDNSHLPSADFTGKITQAPDAPALYDSKGNVNWQIYNGYATFDNVMAQARKESNAVTNNLISNLNLRYRIISGLDVRCSFGYNHDQMNQTNLTPASSYAPPYNNYPTSRSNIFATTDFSGWIIEPQISFQKMIGTGKLEILAGSTFQENKINSLTQLAYQFTSDDLITNPQAAASVIVEGANNVLYRYNAVYGRVGYNWQDKYLLNLTARRDGSSRFGPGKQFGNFGAVGAGWIFTKEKFIENNLSFLSFGKLRVSYGTTGNDQIQDYQFLSTYSFYSPTYQGTTGLTPTRLTNPYFAWEVVKKLEGGMELGFLKDRILLSASVYQNRTGNQLVGLIMPNVAGFSSVQYNLPAVVQNSGIELDLNTINIKSKNFAWTSSINLSIPSNKLVAFPNLAFSGYRNELVVGQSLLIRKVYHNTGVDPQTGLYGFATKNTNGLPDYPQDLVVTPPVTQRYYGGMQNSFSYKGFTLDIFIQYVNQLGNNYKNAFGPPGWAFYNEPTAILSRWQAPGNVTDVQRFGTNSVTSNILNSYLQYSDGVITDASFLRLKNLALSYQIPSNWRAKAHLQNFRIYLQCQNLFTITHYLGMDPETQGIGLPPLRMVTAGLQVGF